MTSLKALLIKIIGVENIIRVKSLFRKKNRKIVKQRSEFYNQFLKPGDVYFDIGANYGNRIEPIIDWGLKIVAVEPQVKCVQYLKKKFGSKIIIVDKGVGEREEEREFYISNADTLSSFSKEWIDTIKKSGRFSNYEWNTKVKVQMTTLDSLILDYGLPKFIKIDVEGFELEVLKGLTKAINVISIEYAAPEYTLRSIDCLLRIAEVSSAVECNYSIGESMEWALEKWLPVSNMIDHMRTEDFNKTAFGDIYIRATR